MAYSSNIITGAVSIYDVQRALGLSSPDLATLCKSTNIKMWAKFRPVEYKSAGRVGSVYHGQVPDSSRVLVAFGIINIPVWNDRVIGQMLNFWTEYDNSQANRPTYIDESGQTSSEPMPISEYWKMKLPTSAFRLTDFVSSANPATKGYFHGAKAPIGGLTQSSVNVTSKGLMSIRFSKNEEGVSAGLTICYEDLQIVSNVSVRSYYFGAAFARMENGLATATTYFVTQDSTMQDFQSLGAFVRCYVTSADFAGTYLVFPFISADQLTGDAAPGAQNYHKLLNDRNTRSVFVALQEAEQLTVSISYCELDISSLAAWKDTGQSTRLIYYEYVLTNASQDTAVTDTFSVIVTLYGENGNVINSKMSEVSLDGQESVNVSDVIDAASLFSSVHHVTVHTQPKAGLNVIFYHEQSATASVQSTPPITPNNNNNSEMI